jgi:hypothetical protein
MYKPEISMLVKFRMQIKYTVLSFWGRTAVCITAEKAYIVWYTKNINKNLFDGFNPVFFILLCLISFFLLGLCHVFAARDAVNEAMCYTGTDGFDWFYVALRSFLPGEAIYFIFTVVPWGDLIFYLFPFLPYNFARFGNYTSLPLEYLYDVAYVIPQGRGAAIFGERFYAWRDLAAFLPIYFIYELLCVGIFLAVFCCVYKVKHNKFRFYCGAEQKYTEK